MIITTSRRAWRSGRGFTLLEVILAIVIALGILVVLLYFYQQATHLRSQAILETERFAAARLLMDRLTGDLGALQTGGGQSLPLLGTSDSLQFIKADVPSFSSWMGGAMGRASFPVTDLKTVRYRLETVDGTNVAGLLRTEEPTVVRRGVLLDSELADTNSAATVNLPVLEQIRLLQFKYWNGTNWVDTWNMPAVPRGIRVSLGTEPVTNAKDVTEYPGDIFTRIVYLATYVNEPGMFPLSPAASTDSADMLPREVP